MEKLLLSPSEVAETLGIGRQRVYSMLSRGDLPGIRVGRSILVPTAALQIWVKEQAAKPAPAVEPGKPAAQ